MIERLAAVGSATAALAWGAAHVRSPMVRSWRPGAGERVRGAPLSVRGHGAGDDVFVLLHGVTGRPASR